MRRLIALSLLAGIILPASSALAAGSGGIGIRLVDVPSGSRADPIARSYIVDRLAPGTSIRRRVEITNSTRSTAAVAVYAAAAGIRGGRFGFAAGHSQNELSSWTSVNRDLVRVRPGTKVFAAVTVDVPEDASLGERYAVIWAEVSAAGSTAGAVTLVNRVGVRMYVSIGLGGAPASDFAIGSLTAERSETGEPLVVAIVHNNGRRTLDIEGNVTLAHGPGGLSTGPFPVKLAALAPGDSGSAIVRLDQRLPRGPWELRVQLRSGSIERAAVATITFPAHTVVAKPPPAGAAESRPLIVALVVILLVLLAVAVRALRSPRVPRGTDGVGPAATA